MTDGDTITVLDESREQHKIRLSGIDAPEKSQPYGQKSKESLSDLVYNKSVVGECGKVDRYRRRVCKILLDDQDVNLEQVRRGMAWHYKAYEREQSREERSKYDQTERGARDASRGLWRDDLPVPPWEFRRQPKSKT